MCLKDLPKAVEEYAHRSGFSHNFGVLLTDERDSGLRRPSLLIMLGLVLWSTS